MHTVPETMRALRLDKSNSDGAPFLTLDASVPVPIPSSSQILIKVSASLINPSDILNSNGVFGFTTYPRTPGRDFAGVVVAPSSSELHGARVYGTSGNVLSFTADGAHAEYMVTEAKAVARIPDSMTDVQAANIGVPFTTALIALRRANVKSGETVMILGATGAVGGAAVQIAGALGCRVIRGARGLTGDDVVDIAKDPKFETVATVAPKGIDVVFDTVGVPQLTRDSLSALAVRGRLVFIAAPRKGSTEMGFEMDGLYRKEESILGCNTLLYGLDETAAVIADLGAWFAEGKLTPPKEEGVQKVPLEQAVDKYQIMRGGGRGKFVIVME